MRYGVHLCYNGSAFAGWQRQVNAVSIQEEIEKALSELTARKETYDKIKASLVSGVRPSPVEIPTDTSTIVLPTPVSDKTPIGTEEEILEKTPTPALGGQ